MSDNIKTAERAMNQRAVYWAPAGYDANGEVTYDQPVEIACWWEDKNEMFVDKHGNNVCSKSRVIVDRKLEIEGYLWLGELENLDSQTNPAANEDAGPIRANGQVPNRKCDKFYRYVML